MKNIDIEKNSKYIKINKMSDTEHIKLSDGQMGLIDELIFEIGELQGSLSNQVDIDNKIFLIPLLWLEGESSSIIEGTKTRLEDFAFDHEEINNIPQWETRNLISLYEKYFSGENYHVNNFNVSSGSLSALHIELYAPGTSDSKFNITADLSHTLKKVKPGLILSDEKNYNYISSTHSIEDASIIMLRPQNKKNWLDDLMEYFEKKKNENSISFRDIIVSHPIFEAIHPFSDGNGRVGRFLLSMMVKWKNPKLLFPINLSEAFLENKAKYVELLSKVQLNNDYDSWNNWISFFISCLILMKKRLKSRVTKILELWTSLDKKVLSSEIRRDITSKFFKYYKLNKGLTIKMLKNKYKSISIQSIYNDWNIVTKELKISNDNNDYYFFNQLGKILREKD